MDEEPSSRVSDLRPTPPAEDELDRPVRVSQHTVDLRKARPVAPKPKPPAPVKVEVKSDPSEKKAEDKAEKPKATPQRVPTAKASTDAPPSRAFWPAFGRFLILLLVLGLLITAGVYVYLNYYANG